MIEILIAILIGCFLGIITGLTPGIHINLVATLILLVSPFALMHVGVLFLGVVIIAMSIIHTFLDFIPSCYLGAPDADTALAALPGHVLLLQGKGFEAVKLATIGSLLCLILTIAAMPLLIISVPLIFEFLKPYIGYILLAVVVFMILKEGTPTKKFWSFFMFTLSGILGIIVFSLGMKDPLFPMLSGLFGLSMLTTSLSQKVNIPEQEVTETIKVPKSETIKSLIAGTLSGSLVSIFPGMGPAQAAILGGTLIGKVSQYTYLILVGGINTVSMMLSLVTLYTIDKARNGSIIVVQELLKQIDLNILILFLAVALITGGIGTFLTLKISKIFSKFITKINYSLLCLSVISFIAVLVYLFTGWLGLLVLAISTAVGIIPGPLQIGRNHAMGCLLLPVILYFIL